MGSSVSRDRLQEHPPKSSSNIDSDNAFNGYREAGQPTPGYGSAQRVHQVPERLGHIYTGSTVGDEAKAHLGDVYTHTVNYVLPESQNPSTTAKAREAFLAALWFDQMSFRQSAINPAYAETSRWVIKTPEFQRWRDAALLTSDRNIFWLKGKPGAGKSTIMRILLGHLQEEDPDSIVASFFFNARGQALEQSVEGLYRTMLHQLLSKEKYLFKVIEQQYDYAKIRTWTTETLRGLLYDVVLSLRDKRILFLIDALDEGDEKDVRNMIDFARNLARSAHLKHISLGICLASRHYPSIIVPGCEEVVVEDQTSHAEDIESYIDGTLYLGNELDRSEFVDTIREKARGVFLWVVLVVSILNAENDHGAAREQLLQTLQTTPTDLNELLRNILRAGSMDERLVPTLLWVLFNVRDKLRLAELYFGIRLSTDQIALDNCSSRRGGIGPVRRYIVSASKGLVEIVEAYDDDDSDYDDRDDDARYTVQFIHESVREHLLAGALADLRPELLPNIEASSHAILAGWCQTYVRKVFPACMMFPMNPTTAMISVSRLQDDDVRTFRETDAFSFFDFAIESTFCHLNIALGGGTLQASTLQWFPVTQWINMKNVESFGFGTGEYLMPSASLLYLLVTERCSAAISPLCEYYKSSLTPIPHKRNHNDQKHGKRSDSGHPMSMLGLNAACGGTYNSPLSAAVVLETVAVVKLLLDLGADVYNQVGRADNPLYWAASCGDLELCRLLLDRGADANMWTKATTTPLVAAAEHGLLEVVQLLVERGADPNGHETGAISPLSLALSTLSTYEETKCAPDVFRLLLDRGADINSCDEQDCTPLHHAATGGHTELCQLLLERGADPNTLDKRGRSPLYQAAGGEQIQSCRLLLDYGADLETIDRTELLLAAVRSYKDVEKQPKQAQVLQLLLDRSTHVSFQELSAVLLATSNRPECLEVALRNGADPSSVDERSRTALHMCAYYSSDNDDGAVAAMRKLLEFGADPNAVGGAYGTALIEASINGSQRLVKTLLDYGADTEYRHEIHGTAMEAARRKDHEEIGEMLLEASASRACVESKDKVRELGATADANMKRERLEFQEPELD
jgi:ankyrin repeat protein